MRGLSIVIMVAVFLVAGVAVYLYQHNQFEQAKQQAREKIVKQFQDEWNTLQKKHGKGLILNIMTVNYPDFTLEGRLLDIPDGQILDTHQTQLLDRESKAALCEEMFSYDEPKNEETRLSYIVAKEDRLSFTIVYHTVSGYQLYRKRLYITECPKFEEFYQAYTK